MPLSDDRYSAYNPRQPDQEGPGPVAYLALALSWLVPGLGHIMIGQVARGIIMGISIHLLFAGGLLLGGIHAINPPDQPIWTYTQFLTGWPMLVANHIERNIYEPVYVIGQRDEKGIPLPTPIQQLYNEEANARGIRLNDDKINGETPDALAARRVYQGFHRTVPAVCLSPQGAGHRRRLLRHRGHAEPSRRI